MLMVPFSLPPSLPPCPPAPVCASQPSFQLCHNPNTAFWTFLRLRHLLHPSGVPIFNPDRTIRSTRPLSLHQAASFPSNWVVVFGRRKGSRRIEQADGILRLLVSTFGAERVEEFRGSLPILQGE